ncbi:MAG TPA: phosphoglucomutase/phosphomannomutase family protein [Anaerolineae bacterium]|nr:phosphoglucomutase/phosphomannomutase family protein [Anaerolineae bacterium]HOR01425.1 phosphoglucomutase/phosphomannomutase family protein [Anaerolineae bacterium]HPL29436.1 phosphoglucomutase/phosphomannomutase family protein [Anaerolineae bacterium]
MPKFGTDGWRAVISEEFTFANLQQVSQAVADMLGQRILGRPPTVVIGYDTRFLSDRYAAEVARVLAANGIDVALSRGDCPTPALAYAVKARGASAGVMITASHNPPRYNGFKLKGPNGGSAMPEVTAIVEACLARNLSEGREPRLASWHMEDGDLPSLGGQGAITRFDPLPGYLAHLRTLVSFDTIARGRPRVVVDPMYGAGRGYLATFLREMGCEVREIRGELNPGFGGVHPEPIAHNLGALIDAVLAGHYDLGLATDGDADRIGAVDANGAFVDPHRIFALALQYLVEARGQRGSVVKTVSTTQHIDRLCERYSLPLHEVPVGFSYICDWMEKEEVLIGGEESGGISILGHIPEGDGLLMGLLLLELVAAQGRRLHELIADMMLQLGPVHYGRDDRQTRPFDKKELVARLLARVPERIAGLRVSRVDNSDGIKYRFGDEGWLLIRPSGTEPVLRVYAEAREEALVGALLEAGAALAEQ